LHVRAVCTMFFFDVVSDGGKSFTVMKVDILVGFFVYLLFRLILIYFAYVYIVLCSIQGATSSCYYIAVVPLLRSCLH
jgi:hypothetical protein